MLTSWCNALQSSLYFVCVFCEIKQKLKCYVMWCETDGSVYMVVLILCSCSCCVFVSPAEALKCNTCQVGILGKCFFKSQATCAASETRCFSAKAGQTTNTHTHTLTYPSARSILKNKIIQAINIYIQIKHFILHVWCTLDILCWGTHLFCFSQSSMWQDF